MTPTAVIPLDISRFYSVKEAAALFHVKVKTMQRWLSVGKIAFVKVSKRVLIDRSEIERVIQAGRTLKVRR